MPERFLRLTFGVSVVVGAFGAGAAWAQDYTAGKTPAQLFQSDCSACHKTPQGLAKGHDVRSLTLFLREHYTTKEQSAAALAAYLGGGAGAGSRQKVGEAEAKPKPEPRSPAAGTARTAATPPAANPAATNTDEKAGEGEAPKPAPRHQATRANEPRTGTRRAAAPPAEPAAPAAPAEGEGAREPAAPNETAIVREEPPKPAPRERARANRVDPKRADPAAEKLTSYAASGGSASEIERSAGPAKKLESYATSGSPALAAPVDAPKADAPKDAAAPPSEGAAGEAPPPADEAKPAKKRKDKKREGAAAAAAAAPAPAASPATAPRSPPRQRRTQAPAPVMPPPGNN